MATLNTYGDHLTRHAIERYIERVEPVTPQEVHKRLSTPFIMAALSLGTTSVRLPTGHRVEIVDGVIVTVAPKPGSKKGLKRHGKRA